MLVCLLQVEFAIQMKCESCKEKIMKELSSLNNITIVDINAKEQRLLLQLNQESPSAFYIQNLIETKLGINTIIRGAGDFITSVSEIRGSQQYRNVFGVARFVQNEKKHCLLDAVIDGLETGKLYHLGIFEYGDLSEPNYSSIGKETFPFAHNVSANSSTLNIKSKVENCDLASFIGRAFAIKTSGSTIIGAGIMARASNIMNNTKKICACDGKTLWEEREERKI